MRNIDFSLNFRRSLDLEEKVRAIIGRARKNVADKVGKKIVKEIDSYLNTQQVPSSEMVIKEKREKLKDLIKQKYKTGTYDLDQKHVDPTRNFPFVINNIEPGSKRIDNLRKIAKSDKGGGVNV